MRRFLYRIHSEAGGILGAVLLLILRWSRVLYFYGIPKFSYPMKTKCSDSLSAFFCSVLFFAIILGSCNMTSRFKNSPQLPGAKGFAKATVTEDDHFLLVVKVNHLINPEQLVPAKKVYVIWVMTEEGGAMNTGTLTIDETRTGFFTRKIQFRPFRVFISAENDSRIIAPVGQIVLRSRFL